MNATTASSGAPPNALKLWTNGRDIFIEIPGRAGPYIMSRSYDHRAISYVFDLLGAARVDYDYLGTVPDEYLKPTKQPGTHNQRVAAEALLLRMGLIK